ncbi:hypothetical protein A2740_02520 [Candidatus Nomurabacteria bacterium RIFCSPHIGHO2_01_FULL_43_16]|nr:MAG: hypothetical protein A2740_02520 [Candidatus Nomurabacteria bacterium RIFCSPHIGHO2_01_FULL_43_16]OGI97529.1 MAG: hypothetical protein A3A11_02995 [Candidatus Nomurabacteria bacterium RIFCSPLOWO2_01_FULL_43_15]
MKIATVIPLKKGTWKENLTYFTAQDVVSGSIVTIPLRNKKILGLVMSVENAATAKSNIKSMSFNLKKISEVKERSIFLKEYFDSAIETSRYYAGNKNNAITVLIPAIMRENYDTIAKFASQAEMLPSGKSKLKSEKLILQMSIEDRLSFYKTLIRGSFAEKKSVFIVLPTEYDIRIFETSLSRGIELFTFTLFGDAKKIIKKIEQIMTLAHPVLIIGTASFLSVPRPDIKTIVLEHESSNAYKLIAKPHFDLRFFTELFAVKINAKFILGDTLLRYETIARKETDGLMPVHPLQFRINFQGKIEILNPSPKNPSGNELVSISKKKFKVLMNESEKEIKNAVAKKKNVFIFTLRKGLATMTVCRDCGETMSCEKCGAPLVLYSSYKDKKRMFVCNRCEKESEGDQFCVKCGSWNLVPLGIGTDTVYEHVKEIFSKEKVKIFKLDKESAKSKKGAGTIIKEFSAQGGSASGGEDTGKILVGTEMVFFYMKKKTPLSVIASFDSLWSLPNFKMGEKIIQIMLSIIGNTTEKLIIQTKNENDRAIMAIKMENLLSFVREELEDRKKLDYPPFKRFIKISHLGDKEQTSKTRKLLKEIFKEYSPEIFSGFVKQFKGKYVTNALIKIDPNKWSLPEISTGSSLDENLLAKLASLPSNFDVFVDPEDLL